MLVQGLEGMEMLRLQGISKWRERLGAVRKSIEMLEGKNRPIIYKFGTRKHVAYDFPSMANEILVGVSGYWGPWNE